MRSESALATAAPSLAACADTPCRKDRQASRRVKGARLQRIVQTHGPLIACARHIVHANASPAAAGQPIRPYPRKSLSISHTYTSSLRHFACCASMAHRVSGRNTHVPERGHAELAATHHPASYLQPKLAATHHLAGYLHSKLTATSSRNKVDQPRLVEYSPQRLMTVTRG